MCDLYAVLQIGEENCQKQVLFLWLDLHYFKGLLKIIEFLIAFEEVLTPPHANKSCKKKKRGENANRIKSHFFVCVFNLIDTSILNGLYFEHAFYIQAHILTS